MGQLHAAPEILWKSNVRCEAARCARTHCTYHSPCAVWRLRVTASCDCRARFCVSVSLQFPALWKLSMLPSAPCRRTLTGLKQRSTIIFTDVTPLQPPATCALCSCASAGTAAATAAGSAHGASTAAGRLLSVGAASAWEYTGRGV